MIINNLDLHLEPPITQANLIDFIKLCFENTSLELVDQYDQAGNLILVYKSTLDSEKLYGTSYLRIRLQSDFSLVQQLWAAWKPENHTGTGGSYEVGYGQVNPSQQLNCKILQSNTELSMCFFWQASLNAPLGVLQPANRPSWWDLKAWNYCFFANDRTFGGWRGCSNSPYNNNQDYETSLNYYRLANANPVSNRRDLILSFTLFSTSSQGVSAQTSEDLGSIAGNGTTRFDVVQIPGDAKEYLILYPANGGLVVRIK